ncbi:MAG: fibronectin type III domain-containing protein [Deltaproteobacteria bacterium]|nr:fibronectin type III domain-containing protein [Deltaproteobacteria bacterium]
MLGSGISACGKKMPPIPPDSILPGPVRDFSVRQQGTSLVLRWLIPRENIEGQPLTEIQGFHLLRGHEQLDRPPSVCPPLLSQLAKIDLAYPQVGEVRGEAVAYQDTDLAPGNRYYYQVVGYDRGGHLGDASAIVKHNWEVLPQAPQGLQVRAGDRVVNLDWNPVTHLVDGQLIPGMVNYRVYRQAPGEDYRLVNQTLLTDNHFQDITVKNDVEYSYLVRAVRQVGEDFLESPNSLEQRAEPQDLTAPAPLWNLVAVPTRQGMALRWEPSPEPDLAGYRVYRRALDEPEFAVLHPGLWTKAYFVDAGVEKDRVYYYYVTAVDNSRRANESPPSEVVEVRY